MSIKVILDTDIGSDIDDAVCLAYLLSQPECELLGITTVSGESVKRAMLASVICKAAKKNIPILPGVEVPILGSQKQPYANQAEKLVNWDYDTQLPEGKAIEFLYKIIKKNPGEITLLAIGPLTNIALLFTTYPETPKLLKMIVLMCGVFTNRLSGVGPLEWNAICDPYATAIVYNAPVKIHRSIGLDVTSQITMNREDVYKNFRADVLKPVVDFSGIYFNSYPDYMTFHDPLAAATIFNNEICMFEKGNIDVELLSERLRGLTYWEKKDKNGRHEVALNVDKQKFFNHFLSTINNK